MYTEDLDTGNAGKTNASVEESSHGVDVTYGSFVNELEIIQKKEP